MRPWLSRWKLHSRLANASATDRRRVGAGALNKSYHRGLSRFGGGGQTDPSVDVVSENRGRYLCDLRSPCSHGAKSVPRSKLDSLHLCAGYMPSSVLLRIRLVHTREMRAQLFYLLATTGKTRRHRAGAGDFGQVPGRIPASIDATLGQSALSIAARKVTPLSLTNCKNLRDLQPSGAARGRVEPASPRFEDPHWCPALPRLRRFGKVRNQDADDSICHGPADR